MIIGADPRFALRFCKRFHLSMRRLLHNNGTEVDFATPASAGPVLRHRFRFGKSGNFMELQIPVLPNGRPAY